MASEIVVSVDEAVASSSSELRNNGGACSGVPHQDVGKRGGDEGCSMMVQCRICLDEGVISEMEAPCACKGTIKFAHKRCLQKWCNEKDGIICEICKKIYPLRYIPDRDCGDVISIGIREAMQDFLHPYDEESFLAVCVALTLLMLFLVHHIFMIMGDSGMLRDVSGYCEATLLIAVLLLPCYAIARYCCNVRNQHTREHGA